MREFKGNAKAYGVGVVLFWAIVLAFVVFALTSCQITFPFHWTAPLEHGVK